MKKLFIISVCLAVLSACQLLINNPPISDATPTPPVDVSLPESRYLDYSQVVVASANERGVPVLFFYASWCPTCRRAEAEILNNLDTIPENITIIKTNYDTESELKEKYGITTQHTFISLDDNDEVVDRWVGDDLSQLIKTVQ